MRVLVRLIDRLADVNMAFYLYFMLFPFFDWTAADCFNPDGSDVTNPEELPCNLVVGKTSMCCATNRTIPYGQGMMVGGHKGRDRCLSNGLCQFGYMDQDGSSQVAYFRDGCNNQRWDGCLRDVCGQEVRQSGTKTEKTKAKSL